MHSPWISCLDCPIGKSLNLRRDKREPIKTVEFGQRRSETRTKRVPARPDAHTHYFKFAPSDCSASDANDKRRICGLENEKRTESGTNHSRYHAFAILDYKLPESAKAGTSEGRKRARNEAVRFITWYQKIFPKVFPNSVTQKDDTLLVTSTLMAECASFASIEFSILLSSMSEILLSHQMA